MKLRVIIIICLLFSVIISCNRPNLKLKDRNCIVIDIDPKDNKDLQLSGIFKDVEFIPLETDTNILIERIRKVYVDSNYYIISDGNRIFIFSKQGKLIRRIGQQGKGPNEFIRLQDFIVNNKSNEIDILDLNGKKVLTYDFEGNVKNIWSTNLFAYNLCKTNQNKYYFNSGCHTNETTKSSINLMEKNKQKILAGFFPINSNMANYYYFLTSNPLFFYNDSLFYHNAAFDTIYNIVDEKLYPSRILNFDGNRDYLQIINNEYNDILEYKMDMDKKGLVHFVDRYMESDNYIFFTFLYKQKTYHVYFNKLNGQKIITNTIIDDITFEGETYEIEHKNAPFTCDNNNYYFVIQSYIFKKKVNEIKKNMSKKEWGKYKNKHKQVIKIYSEIGLNDNPILGIYELKEI